MCCAYVCEREREKEEREKERAVEHVLNEVKSLMRGSLARQPAVDT